jgi:predicted dehydrogenase
VSGEGAPKLRVLVAGLGAMGTSHALAYQHNPGFEIVGLVNRSRPELPAALRGHRMYQDFEAALQALHPDVVAVCTYTESHATYAIRALEMGAHVFVEKPLAATVAEAERVVAAARAHRRKLVIGYILRHHPSWITLIERARALGGPYVFRMNLNQQSAGRSWEVHKSLMRSTSPLVDCGVHYLDVMCQITDASPVQVRGMGVRLSEEIATDMYNYGHLQVMFEDGSVGWYEAGWGPMMSQSAFFVKDVISPRGSVSIVMDEAARPDDLDTHTRTAQLRIHQAAIGADGAFLHADEILDMTGEPDHQALCNREQAFLLDAIVNDRDLTRHMDDAVRSLRIALAADRSIRTGQPVMLYKGGST